MSISEMSDEDRAELFLVLGDVREEIRDLRSASSTLRQVVVPRDEHDTRRHFTLIMVVGGILVAMNVHDEHIQQCVDMPVNPGSLRAFICDASFPTHTHAHPVQVPALPMAHIESYPTAGSVVGLALYLAVAAYGVKNALKVRALNKRLRA